MACVIHATLCFPCGVQFAMHTMESMPMPVVVSFTSCKKSLTNIPDLKVAILPRIAGLYNFVQP
jgi:uncharacterized membrane protein YesL